MLIVSTDTIQFSMGEIVFLSRDNVQSNMGEMLSHA
jgi:hypothetical protein